MESLSSLIKRTIQEGSPLYDEGKHMECYDIYMETTKYACAQEKIAQSTIGELLNAAAEEAMELASAKNYSAAVWVLRDVFDESLKDSRRSTLIISNNSDDMPEEVAKLSLLLENDDDDDDGYWQDEKVKTQNDQEEGQCIADIYRILQAYLPEAVHKDGFTTHKSSIRANDAVDVLTRLGLVLSAQVATMKLSMFVDAGMLIPLTSKAFRRGGHLYRYGTKETMRNALKILEQQGPHADGTSEAALIIALKITLEEEEESSSPEKSASKSSTSTTPSVKRTLKTPFVGKSKRFSLMETKGEDSSEGPALATLASNLERLVEIKTRTWGIRPRSYPDCFIGSEAVTALVNAGIAASRVEATNHLQAVLDTGLIYHVVREHGMEDKMLFYKFATTKEIHHMLEAAQKLSTNTSGKNSNSQKERIRIAALEERYRQFTGLNIEDILNSFYGCSSKDGWDSVDLQDWRNNMKRWGFGRREDQDDEMVDYLAPLVLNIDPDTWDKTGDEKWESPWGILAQIAIFDQIPRSAFRGKAEAFKWDELAIRATRVAIEKGYFETAYKSTLNQFVVLLPLEHSESWEDQKLGVKLLLRMLSTVAIEDEEHGHSPYEIVKRLEFSKRLSTAFLEHAQVIAKFKRYPHRNRQHGRTTTLEERIWLASDLVPRWARSQAEETKTSNKTLVSLPVIPLKHLTRR